jgi:hypothetical protein|tara:strand:+ start:3035 stop:3526 length:492 start_codon:yes stop_codon:yes gene_type:complete
MKLGDYFKKYNIRFLKSSPSKLKSKIYDIDLEKILEKRFEDLKLLLNKKDKDIYKFYVPDIGSIPSDLKISAINKFIDNSKNSQTIENLLNSSLKIIEEANYNDLDWFKRDIEKILIDTTEKDVQVVKNFLIKLKNSNLEIYGNTIKIVKKLKEHNNFLENLI